MHRSGIGTRLRLLRLLLRRPVIAHRYPTEIRTVCTAAVKLVSFLLREMANNPYDPPTTVPESTSPTRRASSLGWSLARWDIWCVPVLIVFFVTLTSSGVEAEMQNRGTVPDYPIARHFLVRYELPVAAIAAITTLPITIAVMAVARCSFNALRASSPGSDAGG